MSSQATSTDKAASNSTRVRLTEEQAQNLQRCVGIVSPLVKDLAEDALKTDTASLDVISHNLQRALDEVRKIYPRVSAGMRLPTEHDGSLLNTILVLSNAVLTFEDWNGASPEIHQKLYPIAKETFDYLSEAKSECDYEEYNRLNPVQLFASGPVFSEAVTKELEEYRDYTDRVML